MVRYVSMLVVLVLALPGCAKSVEPLPVAPNPFGSLEVVVNSDSAGWSGIGVTVLSSAFARELTPDSTGVARTDSIPVGMATVALHGFPAGYGVSPADLNPKEVEIQSGSVSHLAFTLLFDPLYDVPINDSPQTTMERFRQVFQRQALDQYRELFTMDFRFHFSASTDPALVTQYGNTWGVEDEGSSADHLFGGFTSSTSGQFMPGASNIQIVLSSIQYSDDPEHPDSVGYYQRVVVPRVVGMLEVPDDVGGQFVFNIDAQHEFYLVRGDAASLGLAQPAMPDRWYIRRWDDMSVMPSARRGAQVGFAPEAAIATTWGHLKAAYR